MLKLIRPTVFYNSLIRISVRNCSLSGDLKPYVNPKYSYAYGRGTVPLINHNMNYFLEKLEQEPKHDLLISYLENETLSNHEFASEVRKLASGIYNTLRLKKGDTICLWALNCSDWLRIYFACQSIGITVCTVNPYYREKELAYALIKCKAKAIFMPGSESQQNKITPFLKIFNSDHVQTELKKNGFISNVVLIDENKAKIPNVFDTHQLSELTINQKLDKKIFEAVSEDDASCIMYTSGTTGSPKGVVLSNYSMLNNANICGDYVMSDNSSVLVLPLPLFHSFSLSCGAQVMVCKSVKTVLTGYRFSIKDVIDALIQNNGSLLLMTPTMLVDMINYLKTKKIQVPTLKTVIIGAASFAPELCKSVKEVCPNLNDLRVGYGMTETSPVVTFCKSTDSEYHRTYTVGRPIEYIEVKIVDKNDQTVELGEEGEILVRGHNVMIGYFEDEEKTKETITPNRWLKTGDLGKMDKDGYVQISGRSKEMIIKGGENIYPVEIENVLQAHSNVLDAYVFGIPDKRLGEVVGVWIKLIDPDIKTTEDEIKSFCKQSLSSYKIPNHVLFVDAFPMTSTGKVQKFLLTKITCEKLGIEQKK